MKRKIKWGFLFIPIFIGGLFLFTWVVMLLWNAVLPAAVTAINPIGFWQAMGILALSKILFGGFGGKSWRGSPQWKQKMKQRFENMSPEEQENFKAEWKNRCGHRWSAKPFQSSPVEENPTQPDISKTN
ncbi:MAG: hypothetical protein IPP31_01620 [Chitinophagaceae bacterium]|nr:hypothetical protein [Chitinophagaceae bacterium]